MRRIMIVTMMVAGACGGGDDIDLDGKNGMEAAEEASDAICGKDCPEIDIRCTGSSPELMCTGTLIETEDTMCRARALAEFPAVWDCATDDQKVRVETCLNDILDMDCPTQADADAEAEAAEMGMPGMDDFPESCSILAELEETCGDQA